MGPGIRGVGWRRWLASCLASWEIGALPIGGVGVWIGPRRAGGAYATAGDGQRVAVPAYYSRRSSGRCPAPVGGAASGRQVYAHP
jgi:hypothetical protein